MIYVVGVRPEFCRCCIGCMCCICCRCCICAVYAVDAVYAIDAVYAVDAVYAADAVDAVDVFFLYFIIFHNSPACAVARRGSWAGDALIILASFCGDR